MDDIDSYDLEQVQSTGLDMESSMSPRTQNDPLRQDYCRLCEVKAEHLSAIYAMNASIGAPSRQFSGKCSLLIGGAGGVAKKLFAYVNSEQPALVPEFHELEYCEHPDVRSPAPNGTLLARPPVCS